MREARFMHEVEAPAISPAGSSWGTVRPNKPSSRRVCAAPMGTSSSQCSLLTQPNAHLAGDGSAASSPATASNAASVFA